ncbi:transcriptional regulator, TetR family [Rhodococcoides kroppenstedtii]|uniref:Transcriptional regulator, TetR family n=1 Tax=Rhodococcoides kroppenstedtii TaxID=293050 RepID=A0A1I0SXJ4_9NOCA|nr:TetR/AcrR family transcriptional regulator [Rhodococcus kroppenstedtii]SFA44229.1 transcriptional regulator, TetR family [Rhodococcus kroppenstedtii]
MSDTTTVPARRTQAERTASTRARLLDAAIDVLVDLGYARTSTQEIARRAGVSRGAQLHHFPTREALVVAAVEHLVDRRLAEFLTVDRDAAGLELLLEAFSGPLFHAALELWVAARTDSSLHAAVLPLERKVTEALELGGREIYGDRMSPAAFELSIELARGMAVSAILRSPGEEKDMRARLLPVWEKAVTEA